MYAISHAPLEQTDAMVKERDTLANEIRLLRESVFQTCHAHLDPLAVGESSPSWTEAIKETVTKLSRRLLEMTSEATRSEQLVKRLLSSQKVLLDEVHTKNVALSSERSLHCIAKRRYELLEREMDTAIRTGSTHLQTQVSELQLQLVELSEKYNHAAGELSSIRAERDKLSSRIVACQAEEAKLKRRDTLRESQIENALRQVEFDTHAKSSQHLDDVERRVVSFVEHATSCFFQPAVEAVASMAVAGQNNSAQDIIEVVSNDASRSPVMENTRSVAIDGEDEAFGSAAYWKSVCGQLKRLIAAQKLSEETLVESLNFLSGENLQLQRIVETHRRAVDTLESDLAMVCEEHPSIVGDRHPSQVRFDADRVHALEADKRELSAYVAKLEADLEASRKKSAADTAHTNKVLEMGSTLRDEMSRLVAQQHELRVSYENQIARFLGQPHHSDGSTLQRYCDMSVDETTEEKAFSNSKSAKELQSHPRPAATQSHPQSLLACRGDSIRESSPSAMDRLSTKLPSMVSEIVELRSEVDRLRRQTPSHQLVVERVDAVLGRLIDGCQGKSQTALLSRTSDGKVIRLPLRSLHVLLMQLIDGSQQEKEAVQLLEEYHRRMKESTEKEASLLHAIRELRRALKKHGLQTPKTVLNVMTVTGDDSTVKKLLSSEEGSGPDYPSKEILSSALELRALQISALKSQLECSRARGATALRQHVAELKRMLDTVTDQLAVIMNFQSSSSASGRPSPVSFDDSMYGDENRTKKGPENPVPRKRVAFAPSETPERDSFSLKGEGQSATKQKQGDGESDAYRGRSIEDLALENERLKEKLHRSRVKRKLLAEAKRVATVSSSAPPATKTSSSFSNVSSGREENSGLEVKPGQHEKALAVAHFQSQLQKIESDFKLTRTSLQACLAKKAELEEELLVLKDANRVLDEECSSYRSLADSRKNLLEHTSGELNRTRFSLQLANEKAEVMEGQLEALRTMYNKYRGVDKSDTRESSGVDVGSGKEASSPTPDVNKLAQTTTASVESDIPPELPELPPFSENDSVQTWVKSTTKAYLTAKHVYTMMRNNLLELQDQKLHLENQEARLSDQLVKATSSVSRLTLEVDELKPLKQRLEEIKLSSESDQKLLSVELQHMKERLLVTEAAKQRAEEELRRASSRCRVLEGQIEGLSSKLDNTKQLRSELEEEIRAGMNVELEVERGRLNDCEQERNAVLENERKLSEQLSFLTNELATALEEADSWRKLADQSKVQFSSLDEEHTRFVQESQTLTDHLNIQLQKQEKRFVKSLGHAMGLQPDSDWNLVSENARLIADLANLEAKVYHLEGRLTASYAEAGDEKKCKNASMSRSSSTSSSALMSGVSRSRGKPNRPARGKKGPVKTNKSGCSNKTREKVRHSAQPHDALSLVRREVEERDAAVLAARVAALSVELQRVSREKELSQHEADALRADTAMAQSDLSQQTELAAILRSELHKAELETKRLRASLREQTSDYEKRVKDLEAESSALLASQGDWESTQLFVAELQANIKSKRAEIDRKASLITELRQKTKDLSEQLEKLKDAKANMREKLSHANRQLDMKDSMLRDTRGRLEEALNEAKVSELAASAQTSRDGEIKALSDSIVRKEKIITDLRRLVSSLRTENDSNKDTLKQVSKLKSLLKRAQTEVIRLTDLSKRKDGELLLLAESLAEAQEKVVESQASTREAIEGSTQLKAKLAEAHALVIKLKEQNDEAKQEESAVVQDNMQVKGAIASGLRGVVEQLVSLIQLNAFTCPSRHDRTSGSLPEASPDVKEQVHSTIEVLKGDEDLAELVDERQQSSFTLDELRDILGSSARTEASSLLPPQHPTTSEDPVLNSSVHACSILCTQIISKIESDTLSVLDIESLADSLHAICTCL